MKGFVLVSILLKILDSTRATEFLYEFDITKALNETIFRIFQSAEPQNIAKLIGNVVDNEVDDSTTTYAFNYTWFDGEKGAASFRKILITKVSSDTNNTRIFYGNSKPNNGMHLQICGNQLVVDLCGEARIGRFYEYLDFKSIIRFTGFKISSLKQSSISGHPFIIDLQFEDNDVNITGTVVGFTDLNKNFKQMLPSILRTRMNRNEKLLHDFDEINDNLAMKNIISKHPNFLDHEYLYRYLIPNISIGSVDLRNIVIKGLTHFHSLNFTTNSDIPTYTLLIKDIRADMIIYCAEDTSTLKLQYFIESLSISVTQGINHLTVIGENYSVIETGLNTSLTNIQSKLMMDLLERAIGSSLMPSKKYHGTIGSSTSLRILELETAIKRILIEKLGKRTQKREKTTDTAITVTPIPNEKSNNQMQSRGDAATNIYNYYISFNNTTINLLSGNPHYPDRMQCESPANSKFTYRINVLPTGKISSNNNESNAIDVNFHFNYPSVNVSVIKPKSSEGNDSCEFQIRNNRDIEIELSPPTGNTNESNGQLEMKKKIDATLLSMMKNRIIRTIKPIVCLPFNVCTQTVKMVDDFFMEFVDVVLKKCSFRKNTSK